MVWLAAEQGLTAAAIVRESEEIVRRWLKRYRGEGLVGPRDQRTHSRLKYLRSGLQRCRRSRQGGGASARHEHGHACRRMNPRHSAYVDNARLRGLVRSLRG
jgi:hypothetical protein